MLGSIEMSFSCACTDAEMLVSNFLKLHLNVFK